MTYAVNARQNQRGAVLWQRNYSERIIRDDRELANIWAYIDANPSNWEEDDENQ